MYMLTPTLHFPKECICVSNWSQKIQRLFPETASVVGVMKTQRDFVTQELNLYILDGIYWLISADECYHYRGFRIIRSSLSSLVQWTPD
jgi:hypothetical protein